MLIVTEQDRQRYQEKISAMKGLPAEPKVESILNKPLGNIEEFGLRLDSNTIKEKSILLCFFDLEQRPSRNCIRQLAEQAEQLKQKGVTVIAVQASKVDEDTLNKWVKENSVSLPVGMIKGDTEKIQFAWGVKSLPWLILTDAEQTVRAEGLSLAALKEKLVANN